MEWLRSSLGNLFQNLSDKLERFAEWLEKEDTLDQEEALDWLERREKPEETIY